jgi:hypothetical protein
MTKRSSSPNAAPPPKRSRKPAGFRVARPPPTDSQQSSNSSLFITVCQPDERRVTLKAQTRVLASTPDPSTISTNNPEPEVEQWNDSLNSGADAVPTTEPELVKPKRQRKTRNTVRIFSNILCLLYSKLSKAPTERMARIPKHFFRRSASTRRTRGFFGSYQMFNLSTRTWNY